MTEHYSFLADPNHCIFCKINRWSSSKVIGISKWLDRFSRWLETNSHASPNYLGENIKTCLCPRRDECGCYILGYTDAEYDYGHALDSIESPPVS